MGSLAITSKSFFITGPQNPSFSSHRRTTTTPTRTLHLNQRPDNAFKVFASKSQEEDSPELNSHDLMELKFGRLLGEDPKLTLAKIMGRKANPDATYLDIEKSYYKNKGKLEQVEEVPFEVGGSKGGKSSSKLDDQGLVRPVLPKGAKFQSDDNKVALEVKKPSLMPSQMDSKAGDVKKNSVANVSLRKPTVYKEDEDEALSSRLRIRPNFYLQMQNRQVKEKFDMTLLRKPEPVITNDNGMEQEPFTHVDNQRIEDSDLKMRKEEPGDEIINLTLLERPYKAGGEKEEEQFGEANVVAPNDGLEQHEQRPLEFHQEPNDITQQSELNSVDSRVELSVEAALQGKPKRLDESVKQTSTFSGEETVFLNAEDHRNSGELANPLDMLDFQEVEKADWTRAEGLMKNGDKEDVELVSCTTKGFIVSFGSLVGFLPYRNLASRWKFLAFESWLRQKGLDPSNYKQKLGTITSYDAKNKNFSPNSSPYLEIDSQVEEKILPDMKFEDLSRIYDQEKNKFLSSFIGQKVKANVLLADRKTRKLIFSLRPKEKENLVEKRRNLMARLKVGDIVKCRIQKITYYGIFVEVEGFSALIHLSELSWDVTLDPASYYKIGQVVDAKVTRLNFALGRIYLSLKEVTPDPLMNSLESVVGDQGPLDGRLEAAEADVEWSEVESLIKELRKIEGIESVSKGRFFRSPGLAPTFQVYMASILENQYKLLARSENRVQEVIVQSSVDKETMKSAIVRCANRVE